MGKVKTEPVRADVRPGLVHMTAQDLFEGFMEKMGRRMVPGCVETGRSIHLKPVGVPLVQSLSAFTDHMDMDSGCFPCICDLDFPVSCEKPSPVTGLSSRFTVETAFVEDKFPAFVCLLLMEEDSCFFACLISRKDRLGKPLFHHVEVSLLSRSSRP